MTRDELEKALTTYADAKRRHDIDEILALSTDDASYSDHAFGVRIEGKEALREWFTQVFRDMPDYFGDFDGAAYGDNDVAVTWGRFGGTLGETFLGMPVKAGARVEIPVIFVCTFRDGLLASDVGYFDGDTFRRQAGLAAAGDADADEALATAAQPPAAEPAAL